MTRRLCELCKENPATMPDRNRMGRPINRICGACHAARLKGDLARILESRDGTAASLNKEKQG